MSVQSRFWARVFRMITGPFLSRRFVLLQETIVSPTRTLLWTATGVWWGSCGGWTSVTIGYPLCVPSGLVSWCTVSPRFWVSAGQTIFRLAVLRSVDPLLIQVACHCRSSVITERMTSPFRSGGASEVSVRYPCLSLVWFSATGNDAIPFVRGILIFSTYCCSAGGRRVWRSCIGGAGVMV